MNKNKVKPIKELIIKNTQKYGKGVFAGRDISKGEIIFLLSGKTVTLNQIIDKVLLGTEAPNDPFQVGKRTYIDLDEFSRTFNHSCNPSAGIRKRSELFALRDIKRGEQITYDYSLTVAPTDWKMKCLCGSMNCRKVISDISTVPKNQLATYEKLGAIQRYMKSLLGSIKSNKYVIPSYEIKAMDKIKHI